MKKKFCGWITGLFFDQAKNKEVMNSDVVFIEFNFVSVKFEWSVLLWF